MYRSPRDGRAPADLSAGVGEAGVVVGGSMRAVRNICAGAVALIAAFSSYSHTVHVALRFAERPEVAYALPVSVDGMLVVASVVMVDDKRHGNRARPIARVAFAAGVAASLAANIAAAYPSVGARLVAAWPAIALLLVVEMLARPPAPTAGHVPAPTAANHQPPAAVAPRPPAAAAAQPPHSRRQPATPTTDREGAPGGGLPAALPATAALDPAGRASRTEVVPPMRPTGHVHGRHSSAPGRAAATAEATRPPAAADGTHGPPPNPAVADQPTTTPAATRRRRPAATTRHLAQQIINAEPDLTRAQIAARLGLSTRRLREILNQPL